MNDEEALLRTVLEQPDDPATRAIFADWLEEQGQGGGIIFLATVGDLRYSHSYTIVYGATLVAMATVLQLPHQVARPAWRCCPLADFSNEPTDHLLERWEVLAAERCRGIDSWAKVKALATAAPVQASGAAGSRYHHALWDRTTTLEAAWNGLGNGPQTTLIAAYHSLIALAALLPTQIEREEPVSRLFRPLI
ncbi:MAG TPA: TIGR02996 domain-containing protein [Gemmataceae bacterium]|nr:TIGR02996 domain-containing protein [Gemmataceae bacterium]